MALGYAGLALGCLSLAGVVFLLVAAPVELLRDRFAEQVKQRTGRDLVVAGPVSVSVFPRLAVSLGEVSLSAPEGADGKPVLAVPTIDVELRPLSLLMLRVAVQRLTLHSPTIELSVDEQGRRSWEFALARPRVPATAAIEAARPELEAATPPSSLAGEAKASAFLARLGVSSIRVVDATIRYGDAAAGSQHEIKSLDLSVTANEASGRLEVAGTLAWRGAPLSLAATVSPLRALLEDQPARLDLKVSGAPFEATYDGTIAATAGNLLEGKLSLKAPSLRALRGWPARSPDAAPGGAVAVSSSVTATRERVTLASLEGRLGEGTLAGSLAVDTAARPPRVSGELVVSELDLGSLLLRPGAVPAPVPEAPAAPPPAAVTAPSEAPPPAVPQSKKGWSEEPIDLQLLRLADAALTLTVSRLSYKDVKTGPGKLALALQGGVAKMTLEELELYGGRGRGELTLDGRSEMLATGASLRLAGVTVAPLLSDVLGLRWLDGRGNIQLAVAGKGLSERQIVEALSGKVDIAIASGALHGIDMAKAMRSLQQARLPSLTPVPEDRTPFSEFSGTFEISGGVARNQDLRLVSPHLQIAGEGTSQLGPRLLDYTLRTKLIGAPPQQDAVINVGSIEIPIGITGPWDKPVYGLKGQERLTGAAKQIGKNLRSQEVQEAIKGLLRGDPETAARPRELLEKLLKKN